MAMANIVPAYTKVSSPYGPRTAPTDGASTDHRCIDLAAPAVSPICSLYDGIGTDMRADYGNILPAGNTRPLISLLILCLFVLVFCESSAYARDINSSGVPALVGMKILPKNTTTPGDIPGFRSVEGGLLVLGPDNKTWTGIPVLDIGFINDVPLFILSRQFQDKSAEIVAVQSLPKSVLEMQLRNGRVEYVKDGYRFSVNCEQINPVIRENDESWLLGLVKPERGKSDCTHNSRHVFKAWRLDQYSGEIKEISHRLVQCEYAAMDSCN